jgi:hypothetical protein
MGTTPIGHMLFYTALFIIVMIAIYILIEVVLTQVAFWILRPSEMAAMDLVGAVTALGGTSGYVETDFKTYTTNVTYYIKITEKVLCIISQRKQSTTTPVIGVMTTFNCFSMPFAPKLEFNPDYPMEDTEFKLKKTFQDPFVIVERG